MVTLPESSADKRRALASPGPGAVATDLLADLQEALERRPGYTLRKGPHWLQVAPDGVVSPPHGWKFHISSRLDDYPALAAKVVPALLAEGCVFKFAHSVQALAELNDGITSPATVGKAVTVYPAQDRVREIGTRLVELLRGAVGPRVLSDRRIDDSAPVYYRYGPFTASKRLDGLGRPASTLRGPQGEEFDGLATLEYRQPSWVTDPFADAETSVSTSGLVGGRYRVMAGVRESARGNVFRAIDEQTGTSVIVKQARALVAEGKDRADTRMRLRNERRVLQAAEGLSGVPRFIDHLRHADDEFLVMTDLGPRSLSEEILKGGRFVPGAGERSLDRLARCLAAILANLHARGILVRDLGSKNVIVAEPDAELPYALVDFGFSAYEGFGLYGYTPQYSSPRQVRGEEPRETDDLYALGMTLIEAATGLLPMSLDDDLEVPRNRGLETMHAMYGDHPRGVVAAVIDLVSSDQTIAGSAFRWLADDRSTRYSASIPVPSAPVVTPTLIDQMTAGVLHDVLAQVDELLAGSGDAETSVLRNPSIFTGTSGIGLELLQHAGRPGVLDRVEGLVAATLRVIDRDRVQPGLVVGRTGADYFLRQARAAGVELAHCVAVRRPDEAWWPKGDDLFEGTAGVGLAHLWLHRMDGDPRDLVVARRCRQALDGDEHSDRGEHSDHKDLGLAHGLAGVVAFQLAFGQPAALVVAESRIPDLVAHARTLMARAAEPGMDSLRTVSWCNGLTGVARALLLAGEVLDRPDLTELAREAGDACAAWVPRLVVMGQCCGAAGIGDLLIDLAKLPGGNAHRDQVDDVVRQLLLRRGGTPECPVFVNPAPDAGSASWGNGLAGILGFLRRARDGGGPRVLAPL